ncbi:MAG: thermonuclease family protein [Chitinophagaceae bacterium]|nr:thermonuclease family protein [Chitinophagaceae bacterium]
MRFKVIFFSLFLLTGNCQPNLMPTGEFTGKVIGIKDGDTIEVLYEKKPVTIRLEHIDCPEIRNSQPFGRTAKNKASDLCFGQMVRVVHKNEYDRYKRLIAVIINEKGENVNKEMVKAGLAWHYKKYSSDKGYSKLERKARRQKIGIWSDPSPVPPWEWRKPKKKQEKKTGTVAYTLNSSTF